MKPTYTEFKVTEDSGMKVALTENPVADGTKGEALSIHSSSANGSDNIPGSVDDSDC